MSPFQAPAGDGSAAARGTAHPRSIDAKVVVRGAAGGLLVAMVAAVANVVLSAQDPKPALLLALTLVGLVAGFVLAGFVAGHDAPGEVARHGAWAGLVAFVPVELVGILGRLDRGVPISVFSIVLVAFLAAAAGTFGASLGARRRVRADARRATGTGPAVDETGGCPT